MYGIMLFQSIFVVIFLIELPRTILSQYLELWTLPCMFSVCDLIGNSHLKRKYKIYWRFSDNNKSLWYLKLLNEYLGCQSLNFKYYLASVVCSLGLLIFNFLSVNFQNIIEPISRRLRGYISVELELNYCGDGNRIRWCKD